MNIRLNKYTCWPYTCDEIVSFLCMPSVISIQLKIYLPHVNFSFLDLKYKILVVISSSFLNYFFIVISFKQIAKIGRDSVQYVESLIESIMGGLEGLINILDSEGGFGSLEMQVVTFCHVINLRKFSMLM